MKVIALTGGLATGKSTVAQTFEALGIPRIDADIITHQVCKPHGSVWQQIVAEFGEDILLPDGALNRTQLAEIIFNEPAKRKHLESVIHPRVLEKMKESVEGHRKHGAKGVLLEIPLLFEVKWHESNDYDAIIVVASRKDLQIARAKQKLKLTEKQARARIAAQMPLTEKKAKADYVIENTGNLDALRAQAKSVFMKIFK